MKLKIKTDEIKSVLKTVKSGMGKGQALPITQFLKLKAEGDSLFLTSTSLNNFVTVEIPADVEREGEIVTLGDRFISLIQKTKKAQIQLIREKPEFMEFKGNGKFTLEALIEEYPAPEMPETIETAEIFLDTINEIFKFLKGSKPGDFLPLQCLDSYNLGPRAITTDSIKMAVHNTKLFKNPILLSDEVVAVIQSLPDQEEPLLFNVGENYINIQSGTAEITGGLLEGADKFPDIMPIVDRDMAGKIELQRDELLDAAERLKVINNKVVKLSAEPDELTLIDPEGKGIESVEGQGNGEKLTTFVNINNFIDILKAIPQNKIFMYYGEDENFIKITDEDEKTVSILCIMRL